MGYYQGDYRGDWYAGSRGDPGFFSFLGKIGKAAIGMIPGVGGIASKAVGAVGKIGGIVSKAPAPIRTMGAMVVKHPVISSAAAAGALGAGASMLHHPAAMAAPGMRGFHVSKRTGAMVRNRRMRVTNVRALRRAIRRCTGFAHLAKRVLRFTSPRPPRGRPVFKHRRRTKRV
jgi:hypothetical protein